MTHLKMFTANVGIWTLAMANWWSGVIPEGTALQWTGVIGALLVSVATCFKLIMEGLNKWEEYKLKRSRNEPPH